jgi:hypothetical protein
VIADLGELLMAACVALGVVWTGVAALTGDDGLALVGVGVAALGGVGLAALVVCR